MNSIELLSVFFDFIHDIKHASISKLNEDEEIYVVNMILDLEGDVDDE